MKIASEQTGTVRRPRRQTLRIALAFGVALVALALPAAGRTAEDVSIQPGDGGQKLVITGNDSGDNVTIELSDSGSHFVLSGYFPGSVPGSCQAEQPQKVLLCRTEGIVGIDVDLRGAGDKLTVLEALPVPVAVRLGEGNDRAYGNGEPDTCYMEGGSQNQCQLAGGDDVCIGGPGRGDCYLGPGNDSCTALGDHDGCWGGPGDDLCRMGPGSDECYGNAGNDTCSLGSGSDKCIGAAGDDVCRGGGGDDACETGGGNDTLIGGPGTDRIWGGAGHDSCNGGHGIENVRSCESGPNGRRP